MSNNNPVIGELTPGGAFESGVGTTFASNTTAGPAGPEGAEGPSFDSVTVSTTAITGALRVSLLFSDTSNELTDQTVMFDVPEGSAANVTAAQVLTLLNNNDGTTDINRNLLPNNLVEQAALDAEIAARMAVESSLQINIDAEETAREAADADLQSQIDTLSGGDVATQVELDAETTARMQADAGLGARIDTEISDRTAADALKQDVLTDYTPAVWTAKQDALTSADDVPGLTAELNDKANLDESVQYTDINLDSSDEIVSIDVNGTTRTIASSAVNLGDLTIPADDQNPTLDTDIASMGYVDGAVAAGGGSGVLFDGTPTDGSQNAVRSAGIFNALELKQDNLTDLDEVPGLTTALAGKQDTLTMLGDVPGLQTALDAKQDNLTIDATPTDGSTNPIESNAVFDGLAGKQDFNIIVANEAERMARDYTALEEGHLVIQEDDASVWYVNNQMGTISLSETTADVPVLTGFPTDPHEGFTFYETGAQAIFYYDGASFIQLADGTSITTALSTLETTIRSDFIGEDKLVGDQGGQDQISQQGAASDDYEVYTRRRVEERFSSFTTSPFRVLSEDPATFTEGDVWYRDDIDVIRYATSGSTVETVATESDAAIASITGPIATADGGLTYTATRFDGTMISWTTGSTGTTPTPGTARFSVSANPHTIVQTSPAVNETVTISLGVSGTGFSYQGFQNAAVTSDNGTSYSVSATSGGALTNFFTSTVGTGGDVGIITYTGEILYNNADGVAQTPHPFTISIRLIAASDQDHIFVGFDSSSSFDRTDVSTYFDTMVVAANDARFTFATPADHTISDMVYFAIPSSLNGPDNNSSGFYGSLGQYIADDDDGWNQADNVAFSLSGFDVYVISGFAGGNSIRLTLEVF